VVELADPPAGQPGRQAGRHIRPDLNAILRLGGGIGRHTSLRGWRLQKRRSSNLLPGKTSLKRASFFAKLSIKLKEAA
jgi:hypothetical protein